MSWSARIEHTGSGLAIAFAEPLTRLDMTADVAAHFASLLAVEARHHVAGVVRALEAKNSHRRVVRRLAQPKTSETLFNSGWPKSKAIGIQSASAHPRCCHCEDCLNP